MEPYPHQFATALFSFLYHLASYDAGGEALVSCGMMEALLKVLYILSLSTCHCRSWLCFKNKRCIHAKKNVAQFKVYHLLDCR